MSPALFALAARGGSFELVAPNGLWLLGLLAPLVVLYILKIRRNRRKVSSTWLWATAQRDLMAKSPFKRFVAQVPLVLEALALILLAVALARPATRGREFTGDHVAIVVDTSASMSAQSPDSDGKPSTRIEIAKRTAKDLLAGLAPGSDALVLEAGREARVVAPLDRDLVRVRAAIDRLEARDAEGDLGGAIALAIDRMQKLGGSRRVAVVTDGNLARPGNVPKAALPVEIITVGTPVENAAIVRVDVRSATTCSEAGKKPCTGADAGKAREEVQAFLLVANFGRTPRDLFVTMREENASDVLASRRVLVAPGERLPVVLTFHPTAGDYRKGLLFDISPHDAMPVDDVAYGRVPAGDRLPVFLASASSPWIERALASDPMVELRKGSLADLTAANVALDTFVVVDGACPKNLPGGDFLIVHPPPGLCGGTLVGAAVDHPKVTSWENADARMRFLTLDGVNILRANLLKPEGMTQELIRTQEGAVATDASTSSRTGTVVGFDVGETDWPLKASFVLFTRNLLEQARAHRAHGVTGPARAGEPIRVSLPEGARQVKATGPKGEVLDVSLRAGLALVPETARAGLYQIAWQGQQGGTATIPVNLTSAAESDLGGKPLAASGGNVTVRSAGTEPEAHTEWTWVLALVALALLVADVAYLTRRPRTVAHRLAPKAPERRPV